MLVLVIFLIAYIFSQFFRSCIAVIAADLARDLGLGPAELGNLNAIWFITNRTDDPRRMAKPTTHHTHDKSNGKTNSPLNEPDLATPPKPSTAQKAATSTASRKKSGT